MATTEQTGFLTGDVPYLKIGQGPPLVVVEGLTPENDVPKGWDRRMARSAVAPLATHHTVYVVNRRRGLAPGQSMSHLAGHLAEAIEADIGEPVLLKGTSTGGSLALALAVDRPELVRRLVLVAAASRLGPGGLELQREMARLIRAGRPEEAMATMLTGMLPRAARGPARPLARLAGRSMAPRDASDLLVTLDAEDAFDVTLQLDRVTAPTLVIGGGKDAFYGRELFLDTAAGVRDGTAHVFEGWGHARTCTAGAVNFLSAGFLLG